MWRGGTRCPRLAARFCAVAVVAFLGVVLAPQALAGTFVVTSASDLPLGSCTAGGCTLRDAIAAAKNAGGASTITFATQMTIVVTGSAPAITTPVTIDGGIGPFKVGVTLQYGGAIQGLDLQAGSGGSVIRGLAFTQFKNEDPQVAGLRVGSDGNTIANDYFGVSADGTTTGNQNDNGLIVTGNNNTIGGTAPDDQNVIVGSQTGVVVEPAFEGPPPNANVIQGNLIGLLGDGTPFGNSTGVLVSDAQNTVIGESAGPGGLYGLHPALGNVIADSTADAIQLESSSSGTIIAGNFIGVDRSGGASSPNGTGIHVTDSSSNQIGPGNTIAHNGGFGVGIGGDSAGDRIVANSIHDNAGQGISVAQGANDDLAAPTISAVSSGDASGTVSGPDGATIWIEFFRNPSCATTGSGAGQTYLTFVPVTIPSGQTTTTWDAQVGGLTNGDGLTATSTNPLTNDTSMFSNCAVAQGNSAGTGSLSGSLSVNGGQGVDLTALGTQDWAVWGYANNGTSTSLAPDVRKANGFGISDLTDIPVTGAPLRGLGQFPGEDPFTFSWTNGSGPQTADAAPVGIEHNGGGAPCPCGTNVSTLGAGFSFSVPADTTPRTLTVFTTAHWATGTLVASLSDGSAPSYTDTVTGPGGGANTPGVFTITYAAGQAEQQLTVSWVETADSCTNFRCDNAALSAVALSPAATVTGATANLTSGQSVATSGSNDTIGSLPLNAFAPPQTGVTPAPINGLPINGLPINGLPINGLPINGLPINGLPINGLPSTACRSTACRSTGSRSTVCL